MRVAFDIDMTLLTMEDKPNYPVIRLFHALEALGCEMYAWSGGGTDYAEHQIERLGLSAKVVGKGSFTPDLAVDDKVVSLGLANLTIVIKQER